MEILQKFEELAAKFDLNVLALQGLAAVLTGLILWLGSLGFKAIIVSITASLAAATVGFFVTGGNLTIVAISAACAFFATFFIKGLPLISPILGRLMVAIISASAGTILIFAGMTALLLYKNAKPIEHISNNQTFYISLFAIMITAAAVIQLLLYKPRKTKKDAGEEK